MKILTTRTETTWYGEEKVIEQANGVTVRCLMKPSAEFTAKRTASAAARKPIEDAEKAEQEKQRLISARMREIAERELKAEGLI